jgi:hypothetical protein
VSPQPSDDHDLLIRLDTKLDLVLQRDADKEQRLRRVEQRIWWLGGVSAAAGTGLGWLMQLRGH